MDASVAAQTPPDYPNDRPNDRPIHCPLCSAPGGTLVWRDDDWRVIRADDADHPAFYRVVANRHVVEFSDLSSIQRQRCMALVAAVERVLITALRPTKLNLAAFGNLVPHLHWHVIARFDDDSHFPNPVWGARLRDCPPAALRRMAGGLAGLDASVREALETLGV